MTARDDLRGLLGDGDEHPRDDVLAAMADAGWSLHQAKGAKLELGAVTIRRGPVGSTQSFFWQLPTRCPVCLRPYAPDVDDEHHEEGARATPIADDEPAPAPPIERASPPRHRYGNPDAIPGMSTCAACGRQAMLPPGRDCIAVGCNGILR